MPARFTQRDYTSTSLPSQLEDNTPFCAQSCITTYITQEFFCDFNDFGCLCENYSSTGYTLGELAYGCLLVSCSGPSRQLEASLYDICSADSNAVLPTHSVLSLPATASSTLITSSPTSSILSTSTKASTPTITTSGEVTSAALSSSAGANSTTANSTSGHPPGLTTSQAIGISVGAVVALILAGLIIFLILHVRQRRGKVQVMAPSRHGSYDFVDEEPPILYPFKLRNMPGSQKQGAYDYDGTQQSSWDKPSTRQAPVPTIEVASPKSYKSSKDQRRSNESTRTISQLLPDKPLPIMPAVDTRYAAVNPSVSLDSVSGPVLVTRPTPTYRVVNGQCDSAASSPRQPFLSIDIPKIANYSLPTIQPREIEVRPVTADLTIVHASPQTRQYPGKNLVIRTGYNGSTRREQLQDKHTEKTAQSPDSPTPIDEAEQRRKAAPGSITVPQKACPERAYRAEDDDSDTSFEDTDEELDESPPAQIFAAPAVRSPVEYPRIPDPPTGQSSRPSTNSPWQVSVPTSHDSLSKQVDGRSGVKTATKQAHISPRLIRSRPSLHADLRQPAQSQQRLPSPGYEVTYGPDQGGQPRLQRNFQSPPTSAKQSLPSMQSMPNLQQSPSGTPRFSLLSRDQDPSLRTATRMANGSAPIGLPRNPRDLNPLAASASMLEKRNMAGLPSNPRDVRPQRRPDNADRAMALRSPSTPKITKQDVATSVSGQWEQKLTPTRRGDDLYLSVGMITPGIVPEKSWPREARF